MNDSVVSTFRGEDERDKNKQYGAARTNDKDEYDECNGNKVGKDGV